MGRDSPQQGGGGGGRGKPTQGFSCSMPARPNRTPRTSPHLFLFTMITLPAVKVTVQKPNRKSKDENTYVALSGFWRIILSWKVSCFKTGFSKSILPWLMLPDVKLPADEICRIIWWTKARRGEEIAGAPTHPREGSQVCANCLRDPYLSPPIKPISLGDTRISYFLPEQHESCPYFSVGGLWLDLLRHNPWLAHIWRAAAQIYFLLLISFSRTLLHPINFRLWKDRIRHDWTEP